MRLIRRLVLLTIVGVGGVAAFNYWSQNRWPVRHGVAALEAQIAKHAIVTLTGVVRSADERNRAVRLAGETKGVTKVVDKLRVRES